MNRQHALRALLLAALTTLHVGCTIENVTEEAPGVVLPPPPATGPVDTDGDGLSDSREAMLGTSPLMADTDGDGFDDNEEVTNGGTHPLIADVPSLSVDVVGAPTVQINTKYEGGSETGVDYGASFSQGQQSSYSRSDSSSTSNTIQQSDTVSAEVEVSGGIGGIGGSSKVAAESSTTATETRETSTTVTSAAAQDSRQEYSRYVNESQSQRVTSESGSLSTTLRIVNTSSRSFRIDSIDVIAKNHSADGRALESLDELSFSPDEGRVLVPGASIEQFIVGRGTSVPKLKELMRNPRSLLFTVGSIAIENLSGGDPDKDFAEVSQNVFNRTARVAIDFGNARGSAANSVESYLVATNVDRDPETLAPLGVNMGKVMRDILGIDYQTSMIDVLEDGVPTGEQREVLSAVNGITEKNIEDGFWYVFSDSDTLDDPAANFDEIVLTDDNAITLVYLADADRDGMFNREEHLRGTNPNSVDTDSDGLDDEFEVKTGWLARNGFSEYRVFPDPLTPDADGDSLPDELERQRLTDPNLADTDGDGISDLDDNDPTGGETGALFSLHFRGPGNRVRLSGSVTSDDPLDAVLIDWGDGTAVQTITANFTNIQATHVYTGKDVYTVRVTADRPFGADPAASYRLSLLPTLRRDIAGMTAADGWTETVHKRFVTDINGDGYADLLGFGPDGVWQSIALDAGMNFALAERILEAFGSDLDAGFGDHVHTLANVGGGPEPEIVVFHDDGVQVALNTAGVFSPPEFWVSDFGLRQLYEVSLHPRLLADMNTDGLADIVAFGNDGVHLATSVGIQFEDQGLVLADFGTSQGWTRNHTRRLADVNGDAYPDIIGFHTSVTRATLNNRNGGFEDGDTPYRIARFSDQEQYDVDRHLRLLVNITGTDDATADIVAFANGITAANRSTENGFESSAYAASTEFGYDDGWRVAEHPRYLTDISGDGIPDIVGFDASRVLYAINTGNNGVFETHAEWPGVAELFANGWDGTTNPRFAADVNGDGVSDLVGFDSSEVLVEYGLLVEEL